MTQTAMKQTPPCATHDYGCGLQEATCRPTTKGKPKPAVDRAEWTHEWLMAHMSNGL